MKNPPNVPPPSDEALAEVADVARKVLTRPGDELTGVFVLCTVVAPDGQEYMQAVAWPPDSDELFEVLRRFLEGGPGWDGGPSWEER